MGFLPIAMGALSAAQGIAGRGAEANAQEANMKANAEAIRYSPWTHMATQMQQAQAPKGGLGADVLAGLTSGLQQQQNMDLSGAKKNYYDAQIFNQALPKGPPSLAQNSPGIGWAGMLNKYQTQG